MSPKYMFDWVHIYERGEFEFNKRVGMHTEGGCMLVNLGQTKQCTMHMVLGHIMNAYQRLYSVISLSLSIYLYIDI